MNIFGQPKMHAKWNIFHCETPIKFHQHIFECDSGQFPCFPFIFFVFCCCGWKPNICKFRRLNDIHENVSFCRLCVVLMISQKFVLEAGLSVCQAIGAVVIFSTKMTKWNTLVEYEFFVDWIFYWLKFPHYVCRLFYFILCFLLQIHTNWFHLCQGELVNRVRINSKGLDVDTTNRIRTKST